MYDWIQLMIFHYHTCHFRFYASVSFLVFCFGFSFHYSFPLLQSISILFDIKSIVEETEDSCRGRESYSTRRRSSSSTESYHV